jgi:tRNA(adenine34) deaminase
MKSPTELMLELLDYASSMSASQPDEVPVAAMLVNADNMIITKAFNTREQEKSVLGHAELNVFKQASQLLGNYIFKEHSLYVTLEPCLMCTGAIIQSKIKNIYFACPEPLTGALGSRYQLAPADLNVYSGVCEQPARLLIQSFFQRLRKKNVK